MEEKSSKPIEINPFEKLYKSINDDKEKISKAVKKIKKNEKLSEVQKTEKIKALPSIFDKTDDQKKIQLQIISERRKFLILTKEINELREKIKKLKNITILAKLNYVYGFKSKDSTLKVFNEQKKNLMKEMSKFQELNKIYKDILFNSNNKEEIRKLKEQMVIEVNEFKKFIKMYNGDTGTIQLLKDAIDFSNEKITPLAQNIRELQYNYKVIEEKNNKNYIPSPYFIKDLQIKV